LLVVTKHSSSGAQKEGVYILWEQSVMKEPAQLTVNNSSIDFSISN